MTEWSLPTASVLGCFFSPWEGHTDITAVICSTCSREINPDSNPDTFISRQPSVESQQEILEVVGVQLCRTRACSNKKSGRKGLHVTQNKPKKKDLKKRSQLKCPLWPWNIGMRATWGNKGSGPEVNAHQSHPSVRPFKSLCTMNYCTKLQNRNSCSINDNEWHNWGLHIQRMSRNRVT